MNYQEAFKNEITKLAQDQRERIEEINSGWQIERINLFSLDIFAEKLTCKEVLLWCEKVLKNMAFNGEKIIKMSDHLLEELLYTQANLRLDLCPSQMFEARVKLMVLKCQCSILIDFCSNEKRPFYSKFIK